MILVICLCLMIDMFVCSCCLIIGVLTLVVVWLLFPVCCLDCLTDFVFVYD